MRFVRYEKAGVGGLALRTADGLRGLPLDDRLPDLDALVRDEPALAAAARRLADGPLLDEGTIRFLPPLTRPPKIICAGLNYSAHTAESPYEQPERPTLFARFATTLVGHNQPIVRPLCSDSLDYEGEMVAVLGRGGRHIQVHEALDHVIGYSVFNEGSVREYQFNSPQWTLGKNFDATGGFGPDFVTCDEVPAGGIGLTLTTRLNGEVVQSANTSQMIFSVAEIIAAASEAVTLEPGDVLVTGTPAGIGWGKDPKVMMKHGDVCEVEIDGIGLLRNPVVDERPYPGAPRD